MKIQLISDVHTEFHQDGGISFVNSLDPSGVDVLVVAGDLTTKSSLVSALAQLCDKYPHVVYVTGNHEYYGSDRDQVHRKLEKAGALLDNLHWLQDSTVTIEGQRFLGATLWFTEDPHSVLYERQFSDFLKIRGLRNWVYESNNRSIDWFKETIKPTDVVVTHHIPVKQGTLPKWRGSSLNRFFVNDLGQMVEDLQPKLWCYGHTHDSLDFQIGKSRLVCNPFGYARLEENPGFNQRLVMDV